MGDSRAELENLIEDARLVLNYAARTGRLPNDSLAQAVANALSESPDRNPEDHIHALSKALNESLQALDGLTVIDLGSKWRPFPISPRRRLFQIVFSIFAIFCLYQTAYYTQVYSEANSIIAALRDIQSQNAVDKAERLFRYVRKHHKEIYGLPEKHNPSDEAFEPYLKDYITLRLVNDQMLTYQQLAQDIASIGYPGRWIENELSNFYTQVKRSFGLGIERIDVSTLATKED